MLCGRQWYGKCPLPNLCFAHNFFPHFIVRALLVLLVSSIVQHHYYFFYEFSFYWRKKWKNYKIVLKSEVHRALYVAYRGDAVVV